MEALSLWRKERWSDIQALEKSKNADITLTCFIPRNSPSTKPNDLNIDHPFRLSFKAIEVSGQHIFPLCNTGLSEVHRVESTADCRWKADKSYVDVIYTVYLPPGLTYPSDSPPFVAMTQGMLTSTWSSGRKDRSHFSFTSRNGEGGDRNWWALQPTFLPSSLNSHRGAWYLHNSHIDRS